MGYTVLTCSFIAVIASGRGRIILTHYYTEKTSVTHSDNKYNKHKVAQHHSQIPELLEEVRRVVALYLLTEMERIVLSWGRRFLVTRQEDIIRSEYDRGIIGNSRLLISLQF